MKLLIHSQTWESIRNSIPRFIMNMIYLPMLRLQLNKASLGFCRIITKRLLTSPCDLYLIATILENACMKTLILYATPYFIKTIYLARGVNFQRHPTHTNLFDDQYPSVLGTRKLAIARGRLPKLTEMCSLYVQPLYIQCLKMVRRMLQLALDMSLNAIYEGFIRS